MGKSEYMKHTEGTENTKIMNKQEWVYAIILMIKNKSEGERKNKGSATPWMHFWRHYYEADCFIMWNYQCYELKFFLKTSYPK